MERGKGSREILGPEHERRKREERSRSERQNEKWGEGRNARKVLRSCIPTRLIEIPVLPLPRVGL